MNINKINIIIAETINEFAHKTNHYIIRIINRIQNKDYSNFYKEKEDIKKRTLDNIIYTESLTFPQNSSFAVKVGEGSFEYVYRKPSDDPDTTFEKSEGKDVWAIIRRNVITTLFFRGQKTTPHSTDYVFDTETLRNYVEQDKDGDKKLTVQDIGMLSWVQYKNTKNSQ